MLHALTATRRLAVLAGLVLWVAITEQAPAQDAQYWTQQYGNQARLLGGAVVGGASDLSATYYNPGRLALLDAPKLLLAGNVFEYTTISIAGALDGAKFKTSRLGSVPSLFAGQIGKPEGNAGRFAYSLLGRHFSNIRIDERRDLTDVVRDRDLATAAYSIDETLSEYWAGLTWAKPLGDHVGLGISGYVTFRSQRSRTLILAQTALDDLAGLAAQRRDFDYVHGGLLAKVGLGADLGGWHLGLTATTPNLKVYGTGAVGYDESVVSQDVNGDGTSASQIISNYQEDLEATYNSAPSAAFGVSRRWESTSVHGTVEWFAGVPGYDVLDAATVTSSDGSLMREPDIRDQRTSVFNFGIGLEHAFRDNLYGYTSFRTDFTSAEGGVPSQVAISVWDIYHLAGGATFRAFNSDFTLGLIYAFGDASTPADTGVVPEPGEDQVAGPDLEVEFRRLTGLLGFAFGF